MRLVKASFTKVYSPFRLVVSWHVAKSEMSLSEEFGVEKLSIVAVSA